MVLDCVDGNIARVKKVKTFMGDFYDAVAGYGPVSYTHLDVYKRQSKFKLYYATPLSFTGQAITPDVLIKLELGSVLWLDSKAFCDRASVFAFSNKGHFCRSCVKIRCV